MPNYHNFLHQKGCVEGLFLDNPKYDRTVWSVIFGVIPAMGVSNNGDPYKYDGWTHQYRLCLVTFMLLGIPNNGDTAKGADFNDDSPVDFCSIRSSRQTSLEETLHFSTGYNLFWGTLWW
jgi:hypothetical protein